MNSAPELTPYHRPEIRWERTIAIAVYLCIAGLAVTNYDEVTCRFFAENRLKSEVKRLIDLSEVMAHGSTVAIILLLVHQVALSARPIFWWMVACPLAGGLAANVAKSLVSRIRPYKFWELQGGEDGLAHSFVGWLPILEQGYLSESWRQSLPSGHTATAFSLAVALSWAFPRGRVIFFAVATLAGLQRIVSNSHWPSDVFCGAALGLLAATFVKAIALRQAVPLESIGENSRC